ncbi:hypothetical protein VFPFJ_00388 [Purpureocillium lilacinum]|uniref:Uncharacterized protein n=1 Tax=Purpureocillium lilacinum TaxID=33203 RepID=A0A179HXW2_PURLI|nr:hypothetical protein VFPFJ_00388 [Purpureocillium lilacinum]OAQ94279.1 hypothetical protein VFPFJ_00388 [Purpureocillium lilacinum]
MTSSQKTKLCARGPRRSKLALAFASFDHPKPQAASVQVGLAGLTVETIFLEATSNTRVSGGWLVRARFRGGAFARALLVSFDSHSAAAEVESWEGDDKVTGAGLLSWVRVDRKSWWELAIVGRSVTRARKRELVDGKRARASTAVVFVGPHAELEAPPVGGGASMFRPTIKPGGLAPHEQLASQCSQCFVAGTPRR